MVLPDLTSFVRSARSRSRSAVGDLIFERRFAALTGWQFPVSDMLLHAAGDVIGFSNIDGIRRVSPEVSALHRWMDCIYLDDQVYKLPYVIPPPIHKAPRPRLQLLSCQHSSFRSPEQSASRVPP